MDRPLALVTGALGFVGPHLVSSLLRDGARVAGLDRVGAGASPPARRGAFVAADGGPGAVRYAGEPGAWTCHLQDLADGPALAALLERERPAAVYHLAARSSAAASFGDPAGVIQDNLGGALNLLEAVRALPPERRPVVVVAGSAEEYGAAAGSAPCREDQPVLPLSPYAVSKAAQTLACRQYHRTWGVPVVVARAFSHTGPGQDDRFVFPSFAAQIAAAERGEREPVLAVGNLDAQRDFLDVRDVVAAYRRLAERGRPGEVYNICSGRPLTIREGLEILLGAARREFTVRQDPARLRPADVPRLVGDPAKLREATGWAPAFDIRRTLGDLLEFARRTGP